MYHYTYRLTLTNNTDSRKYYIGARSCNKYPTQDTNYLGSCKSLLAWFKEHGYAGVVKEILAIYSDRKDAIEHEINLHNHFDVAQNNEFWNKAKQTSIGFDTTGTRLSEEVKKQKSILFKNLVRTAEHRQNISNALKGKPRTKEHCLALSNAKKGKPSPLKGMSLGKGIPKSKEHKQKIGLANKGKTRAKIQCQHCGKMAMKTNIIRFHNDNCKEKNK